MSVMSTVGRLFALIALLALAATLVAAGSPEPAAATDGKNCGLMSKGSRDYQIVARNMRCKKARRGARLYLREGRPLPGFSCGGETPEYKFICGRGSKTYRAHKL
jgi:hypothetical protein